MPTVLKKFNLQNYFLNAVLQEKSLKTRIMLIINKKGSAIV